MANPQTHNPEIEPNKKAPREDEKKEQRKYGGDENLNPEKRGAPKREEEEERYPETPGETFTDD